MDGAMSDGKIDPVSEFVGEIKADLRNILTGQKEDRESAAEYRHDMRNDIAKLGGRIGIVEHQIGEIVPELAELTAKDHRKQAVKEYSRWLIGLIWGATAGVLSTVAGLAYNYMRSRGALP